MAFLSVQFPNFQYSGKLNKQQKDSDAFWLTMWKLYTYM